MASHPTVTSMRPRNSKVCTACRLAKAGCKYMSSDQSGQPCARCKKKGLVCVPAPRETNQHRRGSTARVQTSAEVPASGIQGSQVATTSTARLGSEQAGIQYPPQVPPLLQRAPFSLSETISTHGYAPAHDWRTGAPAMQLHNLGQSPLYTAQGQWTMQDPQANNPGPSTWYAIPASYVPGQGTYGSWNTPTHGQAEPFIPEDLQDNARDHV